MGPAILKHISQAEAQKQAPFLLSSFVNSRTNEIKSQVADEEFCPNRIYKNIFFLAQTALFLLERLFIPATQSSYRLMCVGSCN